MLFFSHDYIALTNLKFYLQFLHVNLTMSLYSLGNLQEVNTKYKTCTLFQKGVIVLEQCLKPYKIAYYYVHLYLIAVFLENFREDVLGYGSSHSGRKGTLAIPLAES